MKKLPQREKARSEVNDITNIDLLQDCYCIETNLISEQDYTDRIEEVDLLHRNVLCQTDLTMVELGQIEQDLNTLTTKPQCSKQELKLGMLRRHCKKREQVAQDVLKSEESVKFYTGISSLLCFTFLLN